jgi:hypothetical protein
MSGRQAYTVVAAVGISVGAALWLGLAPASFLTHLGHGDLVTSNLDLYTSTGASMPPGWTASSYGGLEVSVPDGGTVEGPELNGIICNGHTRTLYVESDNQQIEAVNCPSISVQPNTTWVFLECLYGGQPQVGPSTTTVNGLAVFDLGNGTAEVPYPRRGSRVSAVIVEHTTTSNVAREILPTIHGATASC